jgi:hypothetical protein
VLPFFGAGSTETNLLGTFGFILLTQGLPNHDA